MLTITDDPTGGATTELRLLKSFLFMALTLIGCNVTQAQGNAPLPYAATYAASFRGIDGGTLRMELRRDTSPDKYIFETRARPTTLASFFVSRDAFERTHLEFTAEGMRPLHWEADEAKSGVKNDGKLDFNWQERVATGTYEGQPVSLALEPGAVELQTIQLAAMLKMQVGQEPGTLTVVNGNKLQQYSYARSKAETLDTKFGKLDTVIYESARAGSNRVSRIWHAPSLGYMPVRAEQIRKGKVETVLILVGLEQDGKPLQEAPRERK
jgi:hypothetical protein